LSGLTFGVSTSFINRTQPIFIHSILGLTMAKHSKLPTYLRCFRFIK